MAMLERSPVMDVEWDGWQTTTYALQRHGWEMAVHNDHLGDLLRVMFHHPRTGLVLHAKSIDQFRPRFFEGYQAGTYRGPATLRVVQATHREKTVVFGRVDWDVVRVDARPDVVDFKQQVVDMSGFFRPWSEGKEELIVRPESVNELMERIRQLQEPELKAIRERNRARDRRGQPMEQVCAQVIAIAA